MKCEGKKILSMGIKKNELPQPEGAAARFLISILCVKTYFAASSQSAQALP